MKKQRVERRSSARLQTNLGATLPSSTTETNKKRSLEGNSNSNSISVLDDSELIALANKMGTCISDTDFAFINMLKDLETARHAIQNKFNIQSTITDQPIQETNFPEDDTRNILLSCEDDFSDLDGFSVVNSKRNRKIPKTQFIWQETCQTQKQGKSLF